MRAKIEKLIELRKNGFGSKIIAKETGLSPASCHKWIKAFDLCAGKRKPSETELQAIKLRTEKGLSLREIARILDKPASSLGACMVMADGIESSIQASEDSKQLVVPVSNRVEVKDKPVNKHISGFNKLNLSPYLAELEVTNFLLKNGLNVFTPVLPCSQVDLIVMSEHNKVSKIQIKSSSLKERGKYIWSLNKSNHWGRKHYAAGSIDFFILVPIGLDISSSIILRQEALGTQGQFTCDILDFDHSHKLNGLKLLHNLHALK